MKKQTVKYNNIEYDSKEEVEFVMWLEEAKNIGFVQHYKYQPVEIQAIPRKTYRESIQLKTKVKTIDKFLLHPLTYTPDFEIIFDEYFFKCFDSGIIRVLNLRKMSFPDMDDLIDTNSLIIYADVKGEYNLKNHHRIFSLTQKIVYDKTGYFINMIIPEKFFKKVWVPEGCAFMKNRLEPTRRKAYKDCKLLSEFDVISSYPNNKPEIILDA